MPKSKASDKKVEKKKDPAEETEKIIEVEEAEEALDDELIDGEDDLGDLEDEEVLDEEEVDPFNDKWEQ